MYVSFVIRLGIFCLLSVRKPFFPALHSSSSWLEMKNLDIKLLFPISVFPSWCLGLCVATKEPRFHPSSAWRSYHHITPVQKWHLWKFKCALYSSLFTPSPNLCTEIMSCCVTNSAEPGLLNLLFSFWKFQGWKNDLALLSGQDRPCSGLFFFFIYVYFLILHFYHSYTTVSIAFLLNIKSNYFVQRKPN